ncbi:MAG: hypothetical protein WC444_05785 [Candidatus Paceibacterota bacterium]
MTVKLRINYKDGKISMLKATEAEFWYKFCVEGTLTCEYLKTIKAVFLVVSDDKGNIISEQDLTQAINH